MQNICIWRDLECVAKLRSAKLQILASSRKFSCSCHHWTELSGLMAQSWNAKMFSLSFWYLINVSPDIIGSETFKKLMSRALCEKSVRRQIIISIKSSWTLCEAQGKGGCLPCRSFCVQNKLGDFKGHMRLRKWQNTKYFHDPQVSLSWK